MVEYKKKKVQLKSGGFRNYYYKVLANGEKKELRKKNICQKIKKEVVMMK